MTIYFYKLLVVPSFVAGCPVGVPAFCAGWQFFTVHSGTQSRRTCLAGKLHRTQVGVYFYYLVTFGGAFFASFPLFYSTSFGGAYWLWMIILVQLSCCRLFHTSFSPSWAICWANILINGSW